MWVEHRVKTFEDDGYTFDKARTALIAGEKVLMWRTCGSASCRSVSAEK